MNIRSSRTKKKIHYSKHVTEQSYLAEVRTQVKAASLTSTIVLYIGLLSEISSVISTAVITSETKSKILQSRTNTLCNTKCQLMFHFYSMKMRLKEKTTDWYEFFMLGQNIKLQL